MLTTFRNFMGGFCKSATQGAFPLLAEHSKIPSCQGLIYQFILTLTGGDF